MESKGSHDAPLQALTDKCDALLRERDELRSALRACAAALLCHRSLHPAGTDTKMVGEPHDCPACAALALPAVVAVLGEVENG